MKKFNQVKNRFLNSKLTVDSFWALFGNVLSKGLALVAGIIVARLLGSNIYGEFGMLKVTVMTLALFSSLGLGYTSTKFMAEFKDNKDFTSLIIKYSTVITFSISSLFSFILFFSSFYISKEILDSPHLDNPLKLVSAWVIFNALTVTMIGLLAGIGKFKSMAKINIQVGIITFISSVLFTYFYGLIGALSALILAQIFHFYKLSRLLLSLNLYSNSIKNNFPFLKNILKLSLPVALQQASYALTSWLSLLLLIKYSGYIDVGLYSVATHWGAVVLFIPGVLYNVILSHLTKAKNESGKYNRIIKINLSFNFLTTFIPFIFIYLFSDFISSFYGSSFEGLNNLLSLTVFSVIIYSLSDVYVQVYISKNKNWLMFYLKLFRDLGILISTYLLFVFNVDFSAVIILILVKIIWASIFLILIVLIYEKYMKNYSM